MSYFRLLLVSFILNFICATNLMAQIEFINTGQIDKKNILIVIGYLDKIDISKHAFSHEYMYSYSKSIEQRFIERFYLYGFKKYSNSFQIFEKNNTRITLLNVNYLCPNENPDISERTIICLNQHKLSVYIKDYIEQNIMKFNQFIYVGHSRKGLGLGLGPFQTEYTLDLNINHKVDSDILSKVYLSSCESNKYYRKKINPNLGISFKGTDSSKNWGDLADEVIDYLISTEFQN